MKSKFTLSCESTVDMPFSYITSRNIPVAFYSYIIDGKEYRDDMMIDQNSLPNFYHALDEGKIPSTSQLNELYYELFFDSLLQNGDVLHIAFGSGMTNSVINAKHAADNLINKYPNRKIVVIDSLCSSSGYGMLVDYAADMRDSGCEIDEVAEWVTTHRLKIHHQFFSHRLDYYRRSGRMSGPASMLATILNICPIMRLDDTGKIVAYDKVRGKKAAISTTVDAMQKHAENGIDYSGKCYICHSNCIEEALMMRDAIESRFQNLSGEIKIFDIGTIIASHCGPGTVAVLFMGDERLPQ